ncbi:MAG: flagellar motor protein MotA [Deltaproteobacteria bacterium RIFOXYD12_FULL_56_24]|nr:MAG: flagellar motor protein MotA [Deltaproteobacteria bacterium RIFOXYD12_FULL_56_24]
MDIATLIGLIMGFGAVIGGQLLEGGQLAALLQPTAAVIVLGGTLGATFVSFPLKDLLRAFHNAATAFFPQEENPEDLIGKLVGFARIARNNGLITLEEDAQQVKDRFLGQGLEMVVDGLEPEEVMSVLQIELTNFEERHKVSAEVFEAAGGFAPTIGIIGAVLGLIHVMNNLSDTSKLGAGIAVAFVATIYGLMVANIVCIPISTKLKKRLKEQILQREIVIEGLLSIQKGENPRMIEKRLRGFTLTSGTLIYSRSRGGVHEQI